MKNQPSKIDLHPRNLHQGRYDLEALVQRLPGLSSFLFTNEYGNLTLDFSNPNAVKALNQALLLHYYHLQFWDIPDGFLCPPIPGRSDYIHYLADLLGEGISGKIPSGPKITVLDIGTGANLIYPILGNACYGWNCVGSELNPLAISSAERIISENRHLSGKITIRKQSNPAHIFSGIIQSGEFFDMTLCNPPFHESALAALEGSKRKVKNLTGKASEKPDLNFGGQAAELWTEGGELAFVRKMIQESLNFKSQVFWFTSLISKSENLKPLQHQLEKAGVEIQKVIEMAQGNKKSRFLAWTFLNSKQQDAWNKYRWA
jgi:23S rRNA (adenine1618-N6)-methyltransferase